MVLFSWLNPVPTEAEQEEIAENIDGLNQAEKEIENGRKARARDLTEGVDSHQDYWDKSKRAEDCYQEQTNIYKQNIKDVGKKYRRL